MPSRTASDRPAGGRPATRPAASRPKAEVAELSRAAIISRALRIADAESPDALTLRRLAQEFDVTPMALYWHVKNKDELLAAMGDSFYEDLDLGVAADPAAGPWNVRLRALLDQLISSLRRHPASASLAVPRILQCEAGLAVTELALQLLRDAGFGVQQAADIARSALQTAITLVSGLPGAEFAVPEQHRAEAIEAKRMVIAGLPTDRFPRLRESIEALTECEDDDAYFRSGTELFLAGVESLQRAERKN